MAEAPLNQIVDSVLEVVERDARRRGVALRSIGLPGCGGVATAAESSSLHQVLLHLILHAIESSDPGTVVEVRFEADNQNVSIEIKPGSDIEASREGWLEGSNDAGSRIALIVARHVVDGYGGELKSRTVSGGTGFSLSLPLHKRSSVA